MPDLPEDFEDNVKKQQLHTAWVKFSAPFLPLSDSGSLSPLINLMGACFNQELNFVEGKTNFAAYTVDLSSVKIQLSTKSLVCFAKNIETDSSEIFRRIVDNFHAERQLGYTIIVIIDGSCDDLAARFNGHPARVLFLNETQLGEVLLAKHWQVKLAEKIRQNNYSVDILSPYDENGACSAELFVGRARELDKLYYSTKQHCHAIVGCRRVGKTSIMLDIKRRCEQFGEKTYYIDCQNCHSEQEFINELVRSTNRRDYETRSLWTIKEYLIRLAHLEEGPCVNIFLDEMDAVAAFDSENEFSLIRELALATNFQGKKTIRVWMAGFKELYWAVADRLGPLYNKMSAEIIGPLEQPDAAQLIVNPIAHLGLSFADKAIQVRQITSETNNHPGFLQLYCRLLIELVSYENVVVIEDRHLIQIRDDPRLIDYIQDYFAINATAIEKVIVLSVLELEQFTLEDVSKALKKEMKIHLEYEALYKELKDLRFGGVFNEKGGVYSFQFPLLTDVLCKQLNYLKRELVIKAQKSAEKINVKYAA